MLLNTINTYGRHRLPCDLTNEEVIGLMKVCFAYQFEVVPSEENGEVKLFVRNDPGTDWGFSFWFSVRIAGRMKNYQGTVHGAEDLSISSGLYIDGQPEISLDWQDNFSIPIKKAFDYLQSIFYYNELEKISEVNPVLDAEQWQLIYQKQY